VWGIFIVAIVERENLVDESKRWFNMFSLIFEMVSAFAGIGLSLGFPGVRYPILLEKPLLRAFIAG
jgi:Trk-type K+ transport system membrane component